MKAYALRHKETKEYLKLGGKRFVFDTLSALKKSYRNNKDNWGYVKGKWSRITDTFPGDYEVVELSP